MAQITVNEISQNYSYRNTDAEFCTVALPITSCWGPGFFDPAAYYAGAEDDGDGISQMLEDTEWKHFPATQAGLQAFIATYRGPATGYRLVHDYSYQQALTLICAGYDVLVCRICPGTLATGKLTQKDGGAINFRAKYPGTFGNNIQVTIKKQSYFEKSAGAAENFKKYYWTLITYVIDDSGVKTSVESKNLVFNQDNATDNIPYYREVTSNFYDIVSVEGTINEGKDGKVPTALDPAYQKESTYVRFGQAKDAAKGTDYNDELEDAAMDFEKIADIRYTWAKNYVLSYDGDKDTYSYPSAIKILVKDKDINEKRRLYAREWILSHLVGTSATDSNGDEVGGVFDLLKDKLSYNPKRIYAGGWDDQDFTEYESDKTKLKDYIGDKTSDTCILPISPLHLKLMDVAYYSRCGVAYLDIPRCVDRRHVWIDDENNPAREGYTQKLARVTISDQDLDIDGSLFVTHAALFAPWSRFKYTGTSAYHRADPAFIELLIHRSQLKNQANQSEWLLPSNRSHNIKVIDLDYKVPKKLLDKWQKIDGASLNVICDIPGIGLTNWGNSTLYEVPIETYQALANLSTRWLVDAIKDVIFRVGLQVTYQYNNQQAYDKMYAGTVPILDQMANAGAIEDYFVQYNADLNQVDHVNANSVVGKVVISVYGVINNIDVDLIAIPAGIGLSPEDFAS